MKLYELPPGGLNWSKVLHSMYPRWIDTDELLFLDNFFRMVQADLTKLNRPATAGELIALDAESYCYRRRLDAIRFFVHRGLLIEREDSETNLVVDEAFREARERTLAAAV